MKITILKDLMLKYITYQKELLIIMTYQKSFKINCSWFNYT